MPVAVRVEAYFLERLSLLSPGRREYIIARLEWFQNLPDDPKLRKRPLRCRDGHFLIDSVRGDRIVLRLDPDGIYAVVDCGGHEVIEEWERYRD